MRLAVAIAGLVLLGAMSGAPEPLAPFFDDVRQQPVDPTPPAPEFGAFDEAVMAVCGDWGAAVAESDFLSLMTRFPQERQTILERAGVQDKENLARIWFKEDGFRHVFCGEPEDKKLGGMHWIGRYLQAQREGWAGRLEACDAQEIVPPVYTLGLRYRRPDGTWGRKCPGGYAYSEFALSILAEVTAEVVKVRQKGRHVCIGTGQYPGGSFPMVVVVDSGAVVTAYPDASPPDRPACGD